MGLGESIGFTISSSSGRRSVNWRAICGTGHRAERKRPDAKCGVVRFNASDRYAWELGRHAAYDPAGAKWKSQIASFQRPVRILARWDGFGVSVLKGSEGYSVRLYG